MAKKNGKQTGSIKKLVRDKGFGFIRGDDGIEYFFHRSGLEQTTLSFDELKEQSPVEFTVTEGQKGPRAIEVRVL